MSSGKYNIIFLDVDGVLNNKDYLLKTKDALALDPKCIKNFKYIIKKTNARVVLSSSWRNSKTKIIQLEINLGIRFLDKTENLYDKDRSEEIKLWLESNNDKVLNYVVIDDEIDAQLEPGTFIKTDFYGSGLNKNLAKIAISKLLKGNY